LLLFLVQDKLFSNLMQLILSSSPLILSMVCSIVLNLYHHMRWQFKLQLEAFFTCVILRLAQGKYGASYQQQEVAVEALVDFCRQPTFIFEMCANFVQEYRVQYEETLIILNKVLQEVMTCHKSKGCCKWRECWITSFRWWRNSIKLQSNSSCGILETKIRQAYLYRKDIDPKLHRPH
jgi:hypothetical protein